MFACTTGSKEILLRNLRGRSCEILDQVSSPALWTSQLILRLSAVLEKAETHSNGGECWGRARWAHGIWI